MAIEWSAQQEAAIRGVKEWFTAEDSKQVFYLAGYAGTGKTTLARELAGDLCDSSVLYGAFTGKAASVMRRKGCDGASTIHSMIYKIDEEDDDGSPRFSLKPRFVLDDTKLIVIDECSMVDESIGTDLLSFGKKVLVLGDPAQLPPVAGAGFFTKNDPNFMLTEVHRQARDNPIIALSMRIRGGETLEVGQHGSTRVVRRDQIHPEDVLGADQVIVGLNRTRTMYNARMRQLLERPLSTPVSGDKLICLRNDRTKGIYNGSMWTATNVKTAKREPVFNLKVASIDAVDEKKKVKVRQEFFTGSEGTLPWQEKRGTQEFTYGYAITCHKSQGSQWNKIVVFDEAGAFRDDATRWRYTAITRAVEALTLVV